MRENGCTKLKVHKKCQEKNVKNVIPLKLLKRIKLGKQRYECKNCKLWFSNTKQIDYLKAYQDYTIHKFTYSELEEKYGKSAKTSRRYFDKLNLAELKSDLGDKKEISLVFDASHFKREFCLFLFRGESKNIHYDFRDSEK